VYEKRPLDLSGSADEIFRRAASVTMDIVEWMVAKEPAPVAQSGEPTIFSRRKPAQSEIPLSGSKELLYDHIRMLDAESYPHAFAHFGDWRMEFTGAAIDGDAVTARVRFSPSRPKVRE
jgi:methionyl-tRNA formyltransferase